MAMYDQTRGAYSPIMIEKGDHRDHRDYYRADPMMALAVMVILVIFIFVIFAIFAFKNDRRHHDGEGTGKLAELAGLALAAGAAKNAGAELGAYNYHMAHDNQRDTLREFGEIKKEIALTTLSTQREIDRASFENYKVTVEQAEKTRAEIAAVERERRSDELAKQREDNLYHRIVASLRHPFPVDGCNGMLPVR